MTQQPNLVKRLDRLNRLVRDLARASSAQGYSQGAYGGDTSTGSTACQLEEAELAFDQSYRALRQALIAQQKAT